MRILLTGATGYIGKRLLPLLIEEGHFVYCAVRDKSRFNPPPSLSSHYEVIEMDLLEPDSLERIPQDIDIAYYLVHSMASSEDYADLEKQSAQNFRKRLSATKVSQVIYLSGIVNESALSPHLLSRKQVEEELGRGSYHLTCFRAGIIVGSGSASFEIIRDLVEKLPVMIAPKWLLTRCQPIGVSDVLQFLTRAIGRTETYDQSFDIGCADILTYKDMLLLFAEERKLKRRIWTVPVMTPRLSSYWLYFVTSTSYKLATALVDSMKVEVVCRPSPINRLLDIEPISYRQSIQRAFKRIEDNTIVSSWKDAYSSSGLNYNISDFVRVPQFGVFRDGRRHIVSDRTTTINRIWRIGGETGWYYGTWLWKIRGYLDKLVGGVGLRRGRTHPDTLSPGDALDFWRVLYADKTEGRLLLFAEMRLPGEAWLEFRMEGDTLHQIATFRPLGVAGRLYWYAVLPFHGLIFKGLLKRLSRA